MPDLPAQNPPTAPQELTSDELRRAFDARGQGHVFTHWDVLDPSGRERLLQQLARLEPALDDLVSAYRSARAAAAGKPASHRIEPVEAIALPENGGDPDLAEAARKRGEQILEEGRVGVFVVAGGQGTRLGFPHPKGCYRLGPVSERSLFEIQAQKIRGLARRTGRRVPWYIMTSDATDVETREAFEASNWFGLPPEDVRIFQQEMAPAFDFEGRLILEAPDHVFESPNGHGGALTALESSGALDDMDERGIDTLFYYQVDNPLVRIADPTYIGFHDQTDSEMSCKVIRKPDPMEPVGVVARVDDRVQIVEYTELRDAERFERDEDGNLRFWAGSIAIHLLSTDFVRRIASDAFRLLPFHLAAKRIPFVDETGTTQQPEKPNGYKLERFVFDALGQAAAVCVVETSKADEFSPVKNASGGDSPESCRRDLEAQVRRWLVAGGLDVPGQDIRIEVDHSVIDGPDDVRTAGFGSLAEGGETIRTSAGRDR